MRLLITVGSTKHDELLQQINHNLLNILQNYFKFILIQIGSTTAFSLTSSSSSDIQVVCYVNQLEEILPTFDCVISHAGAGTILSFIRPNPSISIPTHRQLILVPNATLMDSHQLDLANEFTRQGWAVVTTPQTLAQTITELYGTPNDTNANVNAKAETMPTYPPFNPHHMNNLLKSTLQQR